MVYPFTYVTPNYFKLGTTARKCAHGQVTLNRHLERVRYFCLQQTLTVPTLDRTFIASVLACAEIGRAHV